MGKDAATVSSSEFLKYQVPISEWEHAPMRTGVNVHADPWIIFPTGSMHPSDPSARMIHLVRDPLHKENHKSTGTDIGLGNKIPISEQAIRGMISRDTPHIAHEQQ